jgi:hypothetical protein
MRAENSPRPSKLLRVRSFVDHSPQRPAPDVDKPRKKRFVAPFYFPAEAQDAIGTLLQQTGMGDREGRQLFITATEYELGHFRSTTPDASPTGTTPAPQPYIAPEEVALTQIGQAASQLFALLQQTGEATRTLLGARLMDADPFARLYDERYFEHLNVELERIAAACMHQAEFPAGLTSAPAMSEDTRRLILQLARIFRECLEVKLKPEEVKTFSQVLCIIRDSTQISIPCESDILTLLLPDSQ